MRRDRARGRTQTPRAIMIVERMQRLHMHHRHPPSAILGRQHRARPARLVPIGHRPPARVGLDRHPFGPQRKQLRRRPRAIGQDLHIAIAVQQQLRRQSLDQPLPARRRGNERRERGIARHHRRAPRRLGDQPHRPLHDRVREIPLANLRLPAHRRGRTPASIHTRQSGPRRKLRGLAAKPVHDVLLRASFRSTA